MTCAVTGHRLARLLSDRIQKLSADQSGVSAVEFAVLLPLMLTLYLGGVEVSQAVGADRKVTLVARTTADLISQAASVSVDGMKNVVDAGKAVAVPYNPVNLKITLTHVSIDADKKANVCWSYTDGGTVDVGGEVTDKIPSSLRVAGTTLVWAKVTYVYTPTIGYVITGPLSL